MTPACDPIKTESGNARRGNGSARSHATLSSATKCDRVGQLEALIGERFGLAPRPEWREAITAIVEELRRRRGVSVREASIVTMLTTRPATPVLADALTTDDLLRVARQRKEALT